MSLHIAHPTDRPAIYAQESAYSQRKCNVLYGIVRELSGVSSDLSAGYKGEYSTLAAELAEVTRGACSRKGRLSRPARGLGECPCGRSSKVVDRGSAKCALSLQQTVSGVVAIHCLSDSGRPPRDGEGTDHRGESFWKTPGLRHKR